MGFLDFLKGAIQCPWCGTQGARQSGERVRCPNPSCTYYDAALQAQPGGGPKPGVASKASGSTATKIFKGSFAPARPISIRYRNFQNEEKTFTADAESAERRKNHIVVRVSPTGQHIALARSRIQNLSEVESALAQRVAPDQAWPTPRERQVLNYHKKHRSTSALYEKIRAKYPHW